MKYSLLFLIIFCSLNSITAEETPSLKPMNGTITSQIGISFATLNPNVISMGLNGRYFLKERLALRTSIMIDNQKSVEHFDENPDGTGSKGKFTSSFNSSIFSIGAEKHFKGTKRLSPYAGIEFGIGAASVKETGENSDGFDFEPDYSEESHRKFSIINTNAFLGFDYWFGEGIYIGVEYSFIGYTTVKEKRTSETRTIGGITNTFYNPENSESMLNTVGAIPMFRLGWRFN